MRAKTIEASPRGPNQPTNSTVARSIREPMSAIATGSMRTTVRLSTRVDHDAPGPARCQRGDDGGTEDEPRDHRRQAAGLLDVVDLLFPSAAAGEGAVGAAGDEGGDEAVGVDRDGAEIGEQSEGQHRWAGELVRAPAATSRDPLQGATPGAGHHTDHHSEEETNQRMARTFVFQTGRGSDAGESEDDDTGWQCRRSDRFPR